MYTVLQRAVRYPPLPIALGA